jgi:hypothetical protein
MFFIEKVEAFRYAAWRIGGETQASGRQLLAEDSDGETKN